MGCGCSHSVQVRPTKLPIFNVLPKNLTLTDTSVMGSSFTSLPETIIITHPPKEKFLLQKLGHTNKTLQKIQEYGYFTGDPSSKPLNETRPLRSMKLYPNVPLIEIPAEGVTTIVEMMEYTVEANYGRPCLGSRKKLQDNSYSDYTWRSYGEVHAIIVSFAKGLSQLKLCPKIQQEGQNMRFLGIYAKNREEWVIGDYATGYISCTTVPLYDTLGEDSLEFIVSETSLETCLIAEANIPKILTMREKNKLQSLKNLISMETISGDLFQKCKRMELEVYEFWDIVQTGSYIHSDNILEVAHPDTIATICYTSGTTGVPKGACITHRTLIAEVAGLYFEEIINLPKGAVYISYLPLAHVLEKSVVNQCMWIAAKVGFYHGDIFALTDDIKKLKPDGMVSVPRLFNKFYEVILKKMADIKGFKKKILDKAIKVKMKNIKQNGQFKHSLYDTLLFNKIKTILGGKMKLLISGAAPISNEVLQMLSICFCVPIREAYGQTETSSACNLVNLLDLQSGHVGGPTVSCELKLVDVPEMNYFSTDKDEDQKDAPRGEICFRGHTMIKKYFKNPEKTKETIDNDGWLHTGDVGQIIKGGRLKIIDRIKNIFKLSQGEYVAPEKLENIFVKSPYVTQIFVYGNSFHNYLVAIVVPDKDTLKKWANEKNIETISEKLYHNEDLKKDILKDLETLGRNEKLCGFELVKKIYLSQTDFNIENNTLTPTFKIKRNEAKAMFEAEINSLYQESSFS